MHRIACLMALLVLACLATMSKADDAQLLREQLAALHAQIQQAQASSQIPGTERRPIGALHREDALNEIHAAQVRALIHDVLEDATGRATWMSGTLNAGHDGRSFFLASNDYPFRMNIDGLVQVRYLYNHRDGVTPNPGISSHHGTMGFQMRRVELNLHGYIGEPRLHYYVRLASNQNAQTHIEVAVITLHVADWISCYAGRTKAPFSRDELIPIGRLLVMERSVADNQFTWGFTDGAGVILKPVDTVQVNVMLNNGPRRAGEDFGRGMNKLATTIRGQWLAMGQWSQFTDYNAWPGESPALMFGAAVGYLQDQTLATTSSPMPLRNGHAWGNAMSWTLDANLKYSGLSLAAAGYGQTLMPHDGPSAHRWGALALVAWNINGQIEPYMRFDYIDNTDLGFTRRQYLVTIGGNYYIKRQSVRLTMDVISAFNGSVETGTVLAGTQGLLASTAWQFAVRAQFQLLF